MGLVRFIKLNPAAILYGVNTLLALVVAWGGSLSADQTGAVLTITTAVITIITALATRPVGLQLVLGAVASVFTAFAAFGIHWSADQISTTVALLGIVLAGILHLAHRPYTAWRQGTTADELEARAARAAGKMAR